MTAAKETSPLKGEKERPNYKLVLIGLLLGLLVDITGIGVDYCIKLTDVKFLEFLVIYGLVSLIGFGLLILIQVI